MTHTSLCPEECEHSVTVCGPVLGLVLDLASACQFRVPQWRLGQILGLRFWVGLGFSSVLILLSCWRPAAERRKGKYQRESEHTFFPSKLGWAIEPTFMLTNHNLHMNTNLSLSLSRKVSLSLSLPFSIHRLDTIICDQMRMYDMVCYIDGIICTPCGIQARHLHHDAVELLLKHGADSSHPVLDRSKHM